ncbi:MAG: L,D-transpeptidase family protein [Pseudomonadota bacterium]
MRFIRIFVVLALAFGLSACGSKFRKYNGPEVTLVQIDKTNRKVYLFNNSKVLKEYDMGLGFAPVGHKQVEGDGRTPEGQYFITHRNPKSQYYLSVGISYPNEADRAYAASIGKSPGGDIFIHGESKQKQRRRDWTAGCIAVKNNEIEQIYSMVEPGTPVIILP